jgi:hypothetical protein
MQDRDIFGYYQVGDLKTYSKLEAIEHSGQFKLPIKWCFNLDKFEKFNWRTEPPGSLDYWYGVRAQQLRDKHDYLVIFYSGGADSHNVLMSFVNNNIFVDEIVQYVNLEGDQGNKQTFLNQEVFETSAPFTQQLLENNPVYHNTKHRIIDISKIQSKVFGLADNRWDHVYMHNRYFAPNHAALSYVREYVTDYQVLADQGRNVCFVYGVEKPLVTTDTQGNFYINFEDGNDQAYPRFQMLGRPWEFVEFFYWSPDLPELAAKQAHVVCRYMKELTEAHIDGYHVYKGELLNDSFGSNIGIDPRDSKCRITMHGETVHLLAPGLHRLIYSNWQPDAIVSPKPMSLIFSPRDSWFFKNNAPDMGQNRFGGSIVWLRQQVVKHRPDMWWQFKFNPDKMQLVGGIRSMRNTYRLD